MFVSTKYNKAGLFILCSMNTFTIISGDDIQHLMTDQGTVRLEGDAMQPLMTDQGTVSLEVETFKVSKKNRIIEFGLKHFSDSSRSKLDELLTRLKKDNREKYSALYTMIEKDDSSSEEYKANLVSELLDFYYKLRKSEECSKEFAYECCMGSIFGPALVCIGFPFFAWLLICIN